jgi:hypothetical protein
MHAPIPQKCRFSHFVYPLTKEKSLDEDDVLLLIGDHEVDAGVLQRRPHARHGLLRRSPRGDILKLKRIARVLARDGLDRVHGQGQRVRTDLNIGFVGQVSRIVEHRAKPVGVLVECGDTRADELIRVERGQVLP